MKFWITILLLAAVFAAIEVFTILQLVALLVS